MVFGFLWIAHFLYYVHLTAGANQMYNQYKTDYPLRFEAHIYKNRAYSFPISQGKAGMSCQLTTGRKPGGSQ